MLLSCNSKTGLKARINIVHKIFYSHKLGKVKKKFTHTIQLPKTKFQHWYSPNKRIELDNYILKNCGFIGLYAWQRENVKGKEFVLHDGPPYANGVPHMGHAVNKILKDIVNRSKLLSGHKIHYKPGWDCHGLPIELKVVSDIRNQNLPHQEIRSKARKYAGDTIKEQKAAFKSWGVMADWDDGCYRTFDKNYICNQLQQFYTLYEKGYVYRDVKPVYWSPVSKTALAEAELEYNPNHLSRCITLRFKMKKLPELFKNKDCDTYALIWTTTPWTIPANQAIAFNPNITYMLIRFNGETDQYILAQNLGDKLKEKLNKNFEIIDTFEGIGLFKCSYIHPMNGNEMLFLPGEHVTCDVGTGLVHTAPAHGPDDFLLSLANRLEVKCLVDENGRYLPDAGDELKGVNVLSEGNDKVIKILQNDIIHEENLIHSYPYDWRSKTPVILRASKQWFIDTEVIKDRAMQLLKNVEIIPNQFAQSLHSRLEKRPYWCISRQRAWGVPIPALYCVDLPIITKEFIDHLCSLVKEHGPDVWWTMDLKSLMPENLRRELPMNEVTKGEDIIDIWMDSGLSWSAVLEGEKQADLCVEGIDQFTGWFQSSLLTSVALQNKPPYKKILVHGFALDDQGKKMSKSIGNVIDPQDLCYGGSDIKKTPPYGTDVVRWWVAAHATQHVNILVSKTTLVDSSESVKKLRNSLKFLLGSINDMPIDLVKKPPKLKIIDQYMMSSLEDFQNKIDNYYKDFQFNKVCSTIVHFITNDLSSFYCHVTKDRLYCDSVDGDSRRAAQYVMYNILNILTHSYAPIMPILAEEVFLNHPHNQDYKPFFYQNNNTFKIKTDINVQEIMKTAFKIKEEIGKKSPVNLTSNQLSCIIKTPKDAWKHLKKLQQEDKSSNSELTDILQVSSVEIVYDKTIQSPSIILSETDNHYCERCRKYSSNNKDELCHRCDHVLHLLRKKHTMVTLEKSKESEFDTSPEFEIVRNNLTRLEECIYEAPESSPGYQGGSYLSNKLFTRSKNTVEVLPNDNFDDGNNILPTVFNPTSPYLMIYIDVKHVGVNEGRSRIEINPIKNGFKFEAQEFDMVKISRIAEAHGLRRIIYREYTIPGAYDWERLIFSIGIDDICTIRVPTINHFHY